MGLAMLDRFVRVSVTNSKNASGPLTRTPGSRTRPRASFQTRAGMLLPVDAIDSFLDIVERSMLHRLDCADRSA
jgi:hypothetical protein